MKTKFIDIPKDQRKEVFKMALDAFYKLERHVFDIRRMRYNDTAIPAYYIYKLTKYQHLRFYDSPGNSDPERIEFVSKYPEGSVMFVVTNRDWPRKLFFDLMKSKQHTTAN